MNKCRYLQQNCTRIETLEPRVNIHIESHYKDLYIVDPRSEVTLKPQHLLERSYFIKRIQTTKKVNRGGDHLSSFQK